MVTDNEILDFIDGKLSPSDAMEFQKKLDSNEEFNLRFQNLQLVDKNLSEIPNMKPNRNFTDKVMVNLNRSMESAGVDLASFWKKNLIVVIGIASIGLFAAVALMLIPGFTDILPAITPQEFSITDTTIRLDPGSMKLFDGNLFIKGILYLNAIIILFLLEKAILKPFFRHRKQKFSY